METNTLTTEGAVITLDITKPVYEIHIQSKNGHDTFKLNLSDTVERIFGHFKSNKLWAIINDGIFKTGATFNGTSEDNKIIENDKIRLRDLLSSLTTVDVAFPGQFITPSVKVMGRVKGGRP